MGSQNYIETLRTIAVSASSNGANEIIPAPTEAGQFICIDLLAFIAAGAVDVTLKSATTSLSGAMTLAQNQAVTLENAMGNDDGIITCAPGEAFNITLSAGVAINGIIRYRLKGGI